MIANWMARLQAYPRRILVGFGLVLMLALISVSRLQVDSDLYDLLPSTIPGLESFLETSRTFGSLDAVYGLFEGSDPRAVRACAEAFGREVARSPEVAHVQTRFPRETAIARGVPPSAIFFVGPQVVERLRNRLDPDGFRSILEKVRRRLLTPLGARMASRIQADPLGLQLILLRGLSKLPRPAVLDEKGYWGREVSGRYLVFVSIRPTYPMGDMASSRAFMAAVRHAEKTARDSQPRFTDVKAGFTGGHAVAVEEETALHSDIVNTLILSLVLVLGVFWLFFRGARVLLALSVSLIGSLLIGLGILGVYPGQINPITAGFAAVLCGLAVDYGIHIYNAVRHAGQNSLRDVYRVAGRSVCLGALTTATAFGTLGVSEFPGMRQFGWVMVAGIVGALVVMTTAFLPLVGVVETVRTAKIRGPLEDWVDFLWKERRVLSVAAILLVFGVAWVGWSRVKFEPNVRKLAARGETWTVQERILSLFGNRLEPLVFRWKGDKLSDGLQAMARLERAAAGSDDVDHFDTPLLLFPPPEGVQRARAALSGLEPSVLCDSLQGNALEAGFVPHAFDQACTGLKTLIDVGHLPLEEALKKTILPSGYGQEWMRRFYRLKGGEVQLAAYVYPQTRLTSPGEADALAMKLGAVGPPWTVSGIGLLSGPLRKQLVQDAKKVTAIALGLVAVVACLGLRSPVRGLVALIPVGTAAIVTLGLMGIAGIPLNPINFAAVPLVLGLGIDDGLHIVTHAWARPEQSVGEVLQESGWSITCTTATTIAGFGSLLASQHPGLASMGGMVCLGVGTSWLATVVFLPPLLMFIRKGNA